MKNDLKSQRLDSEIYKQKNDKSAKNAGKWVCSTGTLANPRRLRYQKNVFCKTQKTLSGLPLWKFGLGTLLFRLRKSCF